MGLQDAIGKCLALRACYCRVTCERSLHRGFDGALRSGGPHEMRSNKQSQLDYNSMAGAGGMPSLVVDNGHGRPVTTGSAWNEQWGPQLDNLHMCMRTYIICI